MIRRGHPAVRAMMEDNDYPEHVQREFDKYWSSHNQLDAIDSNIWQQEGEQFPPAWHDLALVAVGAVIVAAVLFAWLS